MRKTRLRSNNTIRENISKYDAALKGMTRYRTGLPCRRGHISDRFVSGGACCECVQPMVRVCGSDEKFIALRVAIPAPVTLEAQQELERLIRGWSEVKLREWGYVK